MPKTEWAPIDEGWRARRYTISAKEGILRGVIETFFIVGGALNLK